MLKIKPDGGILAPNLGPRIIPVLLLVTRPTELWL